MRLIAHRGLMRGPNRSAENHPGQIDLALGRGYDCEIDAWRQNGHWALGHDAPTHSVDLDFLRRDGLWIHCKNLEAFFALKGLASNAFNFFWHESDAVAFTSCGYVWTYFGAPETESPASICVMPEVSRSLEEIRTLRKTAKWFGLCSDHVEAISNGPPS